MATKPDKESSIDREAAKTRSDVVDSQQFAERRTFKVSKVAYKGINSKDSWFARNSDCKDTNCRNAINLSKQAWDLAERSSKPAVPRKDEEATCKAGKAATYSPNSQRNSNWRMQLSRHFRTQSMSTI